MVGQLKIIPEKTDIMHKIIKEHECQMLVATQRVIEVGVE